MELGKVHWFEARAHLEFMLYTFSESWNGSAEDYLELHKKITNFIKEINEFIKEINEKVYVNR